MNSILMQSRGDPRRRGVVAVQVVVLSGVMFGFAALTIDMGQIYKARGDLQHAADSAALAAASAYISDSMVQVRIGTNTTSAFSEVTSRSSSLAGQFSSANYTLDQSTILESQDFSMGWLDMSSPTSTLVTGVAPNGHNAVRVMVRRDSTSQGQTNGPIDLFFAPIFGQYTGNASASAVAVFDDRFAGFDTSLPGAGALTPLSIRQDSYNAQLVGGNDGYSYDSTSSSVLDGSDGVNEINIYPDTSAPGNFGLLNIGTPNQGVPGLADQIENGVSAADMNAEIGTSLVDFSSGPTTYQITGDPGMKSALQSSFELRVGDVIGFFLHTTVTAQGSNTVYTIVDLRFGRLMDVQLNGNPNSRGVWVQPAVFSGAGVVVSAGASSSGGMVGRLVLAR